MDFHWQQWSPLLVSPLCMSQPSSCHIMYVSPRAEIADTMTKALHFNTYGGNPMACAVGSAVLDVSSSCIIVGNTDNLNLRQSTLVF